MKPSLHGMIEIRVNIAHVMSDGGGVGLPQMSEREMFEKLLSSGSDYGEGEPPVSYTHLTLPTIA